MKRSNFFRLCLSTAAAISVPFQILAKTALKSRETKGFFVANGADRKDNPLSIFEGDIFSTKVGTEDTEGDIYVFESSRVKEGGPTLHYHFNQDEWWYVLKGEFLIKVGEKTYEAKAGDSVFGPRMVPHAFAKIGEGEARLLMFFQPAGKMELFFNKINKGATKGMTEEQQDKFREEHGFKRVGPPLKQLKKMER